MFASQALLLFSAIAGAQNVPAKEMLLNIDALPIVEALNGWAQQTGMQVIVMIPEELKGSRLVAPAVKGSFTTRAALEYLLGGTQLTYELVNDRTVVIHGQRKQSTGTHDHGDKKLMRLALQDASPKQSSGVGISGNQRSVAATSDVASSERNVEEVLVTGTRFSDRTPLTSPVPVDLVSASDLRAGGRTELAESLSASVPALNFTLVSTAGTASATRPFTYRGLPPNAVLVLVNGKRWHATTPKGLGIVTFDFNSIPPTSVGSVEVLRDGASAQYGSDAIAGVLNVRLRRDIDNELSATTSQYFAGDGLTTEVSFDTGLAFAGDGFVHLSTYFRDSESTNRQGRDVRQQYFATAPNGNSVNLGVVNSQTDLTPVLPPGFSFDPRESTGVARSNNFLQGNAERREAGLSFNSEVPIGDTVTLYSFGGYTQRNVKTPFTWRTPRDNVNVRAIYPDGYAPVFDADITDVQLAAGLKGHLGEWQWDLSESWGFNKLESRAENTVNVSMGAASPTSFFAGQQRTDQATTNLDLKREFDVGLRSPLRVAVGSEYRREGFDVDAGEAASYINGGIPILDGPSAGAAAAVGSQGIVGYGPADVVDASRHSVAGYVDLENQLTDGLLVTLAGRYEDYSDFGSTINGKLSFRQEFNRVFSVRGSASTGFRAPNLYESYFSNTGSQVISGQYFINRHFPVSDPVAQALGARQLEPEESVNYSLGTVFRITERLSLTADVYRIYVRDSIIQSSTFNDAGTRAFLAARGFIGISAASFFTNAVDKRVDGIDITADYATELGANSRLALTLGANFNDPQVTSVDPTPPELAAVTSIPLFNERSIVAVERGAPRSRINLGVTYGIGDLDVTVRGTRYGSTQELGGNPAVTNQVYDAKWITDLDITYDMNDAVSLTVGAQNLFDVYPEENSAYNNPGGFLKYPFNFGNAPFGLSGGLYYARAIFKF